MAFLWSIPSGTRFPLRTTKKNILTYPINIKKTSRQEIEKSPFTSILSIFLDICGSVRLLFPYYINKSKNICYLISVNRTVASTLSL